MADNAFYTSALAAMPQLAANISQHWRNSLPDASDDSLGLMFWKPAFRGLVNRFDGCVHPIRRAFLVFAVRVVEPIWEDYIFPAQIAENKKFRNQPGRLASLAVKVLAKRLLGNTEVASQTSRRPANEGWYVF